MNQQMSVVAKDVNETIALGEQIGSRLKGGEVFELISDLGGGKTTFVRGLAKGFGSGDPVASPTFTISFVYSRGDGRSLHHFDFYRLSEPGIIASELAEAINDNQNVVAVEWGEIVADVLPSSKITLNIKNVSDGVRQLQFSFNQGHSYLFEGLEQ